jgi:hypothetical protein
MSVEFIKDLPAAREIVEHLCENAKPHEQVAV